MQTNVVKHGYVTFEQQYKCRDCNKYFISTSIDDIDPQEVQRLLSSGVHRYAIAREYGCTNTAINRYIKKYNLNIYNKKKYETTKCNKRTNGRCFIEI